MPADRFATAQQFANALVVSQITLITPSDGTAVRSHHIRNVTLLAASIFGAVAATAVAAGFWQWLRRASATPELTTRFSVVLATDVHFMPEKGAPTVALSPDGTRLVYLARDSTGVRLYHRTIDQLEAQPIPGTEDASMPFVSPDGQWVGFVSDGQLKKVPLAGGPPVAIGEMTRPRGATWSSDGSILFTGTPRAGVFRVSAAGGQPEEITRPRPEQGELDHRWVESLPGNRAALFTVWTGNAEDARIAVVSLETGITKTLFLGTYARYSPTGHIVYTQVDGSLLAAPFDVKALQVVGPSVPMLDGITVKLTGAADVTLSASGSLAYLDGGPVKHTLVLVGPGDDVRVLLEGPPSPRTPRFSPDGRRVAVTLQESRNVRDVWLYQLEHGPLSRLTFGGGHDPVWTPDGSRVTFTSEGNLNWIQSDLSASHEALLTGGQSQTTGSWSPDGRFLVFVRSDPSTLADLWLLSLDDQPRSRPLLQTPFSEEAPALSPDGRWLAYQSNESGDWEVFVRPFPTFGPKWQVSLRGGVGPRWAKKGQKLLYWASGDSLIAAAISSEPEFRVQDRRVVFDKAWLASARDYDVHPDGERLLMAKVEAGVETARLVVVQHWITELRQRFERR